MIPQRTGGAAARYAAGALTLVAILLGQAQIAGAHFLWSVVETGLDGKAKARLFFGEEPAPGEANLVERMAKVEASVGGAAKLALQPSTTGDVGEMNAAIEAGKGQDLTARWEYGLFTRDEEPRLLWYYARYQDTKATPAAASAGAELPLDLVAVSEGGKTRLRLTWNGKPVSNETIFTDGLPDVNEMTTDANGEIVLPALPAGVYGFRARHADETPGEKDGQKYNGVVHWSTLALRTSEGKAAPSKAAADALENARLGRALWTGFPGFTANITVNSAGKVSQGKLTVTADGDVKLEGIEDKGLQMMLDSLVSHRLSDTNRDDDVSYGDDKADHPLGQLINLDYDTSMGSAYRIKGDVVAEVNRTNDDGGRFTISVLDVYRNAEGKYLPSVYTINTWDKDGGLQSSITTQDRWARIGGYDLPVECFTIRSAKQQQQVRKVTFSDHQMLPKQ